MTLKINLSIKSSGERLNIVSEGFKNDATIDFQVIKSISPVENLAIFKLNNLSYEALEILSLKKASVILEVSRDDVDLGVLFIGSIFRTYQKRVDDTREIEVFASTILRTTNNLFEKKYRANTSVAFIIRDIAFSLGVIIGKINVSGSIGEKGRVFNDINFRVLNQLAKEFKFDWNIQNNQFFAINDTSLGKEQNLEVSAKLGNLIEATPSYAGNNVYSELVLGVDLLLPFNSVAYDAFNKIKIDSINSKESNGTFKIHKAVYSSISGGNNTIGINCMRY